MYITPLGILILVLIFVHLNNKSKTPTISTPIIDAWWEEEKARVKAEEAQAEEEVQAVVKLLFHDTISEHTPYKELAGVDKECIVKYLEAPESEKANVYEEVRGSIKVQEERESSANQIALLFYSMFAITVFIAIVAS